MPLKEIERVIIALMFETSIRLINTMISLDGLLVLVAEMFWSSFPYFRKNRTNVQIVCDSLRLRGKERYVPSNFPAFFVQIRFVTGLNTAIWLWCRCRCILGYTVLHFIAI